MFVSSRPLPEDDSIEADILGVPGPENQPGKNLMFSFSVDFMLIFSIFCFCFCPKIRNNNIEYLLHHRELKDKLNLKETFLE